MTAMTAGTAMLVGMAGSAILNTVLAPDAPAALTPPPVTPPTPMALLPKTTQKKTEQEAALATAGQMTPQNTLLSGNEKRSVLGG